MTDGFGAVSGLIDSYRQDMIGRMKEMIPIRAISPSSGGEGELERAMFLDKLLGSWGIKTRRYDYKDDTGAIRPNIIARIGNAKKTIWFVGHTDTVAEGDRSLWKGDPFCVRIDGDRMYGRGTNDNGQGVMSSIYAMRAIKESGIDTGYNFGLVLAADEEVGSRYGMQKLVEEKGLFSKSSDMFVVPDWGNDRGDIIEVGEKGLLWLKVTVKGKQVHASTPDLGVNAYRYSIRFLYEADEMLHSKYGKTNSLFNPNVSTFEMTKHEKNVDSTNIIPGIEVSYIDCRVLPDYRLDDVLCDIKAIARRFPQVSISIDPIVREDPAAATQADSEVVRILASSVHRLKGIKPRLMGIGGGTCAAFPRKKGMQAAVWSTEPDIAHQPNEYTRISYVLGDAKVFAHMVL
jgi:succinyl-diaminopimelate desuccinylase